MSSRPDLLPLPERGDGLLDGGFEAGMRRGLEVDPAHLWEGLIAVNRCLAALLTPRVVVKERAEGK